MNPAFPTIGSRMTPEIASGFSAKSSFTASRSLYGAVSVFAVVVLGTPGESVKPNVATPEPAFTKNISAWP